MSLLVTIIVVLILGLAAWGVNKAPFVQGEFKQLAVFVLIVVAVIVVVYFLIGLVHGSGAGTLNLT